MVHEILEIQPLVEREGLGSDSQDLMDHQTDLMRQKLTLS